MDPIGYPKRSRANQRSRERRWGRFRHWRRSRCGEVRVSVMRKMIYILIWAAISLLAGAAGNYFVSLDFWWSSLIVGIALIVNGFIAEWEDRDKK